MAQQNNEVYSTVELSEPKPAVVVAGTVVQPPIGQPYWASEFCCWDNCGCQKDCGLCVYAICCPYCAYAEVMEHIDQPSCCCEVGFCNSLLCVMTGGFISYILQTVMYSTGIGAGGAWAVNFTPCITCEARQALGKKYSLPTNDCCCPCAAHYFCQGCSIYQESVYVKHVLKKDMNCCCYVNCCRGSKPGDFKGKILANQGNGVISTQPHSNV